MPEGSAKDAGHQLNDVDHSAVVHSTWPDHAERSACRAGTVRGGDQRVVMQLNIWDLISDADAHPVGSARRAEKMNDDVLVLDQFDDAAQSLRRIGIGLGYEVRSAGHVNSSPLIGIADSADLIDE